MKNCKELKTLKFPKMLCSKQFSTQNLFIRQARYCGRFEKWKKIKTEAYARNLFVNHRACALNGINPAEFFSESDTSKFYPDCGDIVQLSGK